MSQKARLRMSNIFLLKSSTPTPLAVDMDNAAYHKQKVLVKLFIFTKTLSSYFFESISFWSFSKSKFGSMNN